jgi:heptosyltransferase-2
MRNILVIRFSSLGDIVLTLPVIQALRDAYPDARIRVSVKEQYASLFAGSRLVDQVLPLASRGEHRGFGGLRRYAEQIRRIRPDLIVDLHGSARSRLLSYLLPDARVLRVPLQHFRRQALVRFKRPVLGYPGHMVERYLAVLESLAIPRGNRRPRLTASEGGENEARVLLESWGVRERSGFIILAPGAGRKSKRWSGEHFAELARRLAEDHQRPVAVIGSSDEAGLVNQIVGMAGSPRVFPHPSSDLMVQAALLARASGLVTNDSGLMHLAVAVGAPVVAIFGSTTPSLGFYPLGEADRILSIPLDCRPCSLHGLDTCPRGDLACLEGISPDRVLDAVLAIGKPSRA